MKCVCTFIFMYVHINNTRIYIYIYIYWYRQVLNECVGACVCVCVRVCTCACECFMSDLPVQITLGKRAQYIRLYILEKSPIHPQITFCIWKWASICSACLHGSAIQVCMYTYIYSEPNSINNRIKRNKQTINLYQFVFWKHQIFCTTKLSIFTY